MKLNVIGLQLRTGDADTERRKDANVDHIIAQIDACEPCDLIVTPELSTVGYGDRVFEKLPLVADQIESDTIHKIQNAAKRNRAFVALGFAEKHENKYYNSVAIINDGGELIDVYRKAHLPLFTDTMEGKHFLPGDRLVSFKIKGFTVGVSICYDIRFPEVARRLSLIGAIDLLIHPTYFFDDETFSSWHPFVVTRAIENQIYVLSVNRAGEHSGRSILCPGW